MIKWVSAETNDERKEMKRLSMQCNSGFRIHRHCLPAKLVEPKLNFYFLHRLPGWFILSLFHVTEKLFKIWWGIYWNYISFYQTNSYDDTAWIFCQSTRIFSSYEYNFFPPKTFSKFILKVVTLKIWFWAGSTFLPTTCPLSFDYCLYSSTNGILHPYWRIS